MEEESRKIEKLHSSASIVAKRLTSKFKKYDLNLEGNYSVLKNRIIQSIDEKTKGTILRAMAIFTAIELYGSFLSGNTGPGNTKNNFSTFCKSKYMPQKYHKLKDLLYNLFRNGITHSYIPKGSAHLSGNPLDKESHLKFLEDGLFIYVPKLAEDVTKAIKLFYEDLKDSKKLKSNYQKIFLKLDDDGGKEYLKFIEDNNIITIDNIKIEGDIDFDKEAN